MSGPKRISHPYKRFWVNHDSGIRRSGGLVKGLQADIEIMDL